MNNKKIINNVSKEYIGSLKILHRKTKNPVVVALVGLIGSGKSSVAKALSPLIGATIISGDAIRVALKKMEQNYNPVQNITMKAMAAVLKVGGNVIIDSDFVDLKKRKDFIKNLRMLNAGIIYLRIFADIDIMIERLIKAKYNPDRDLFKNAAIAIREMWRRTPYHYNWSPAGGGRFALKKIKIPFIDRIDTTTPEWHKKIRETAAKIRKF